MSIIKKSCSFAALIALAGFIFATEAAAQKPVAKPSKISPSQQQTKSATAADAGDAASSDAEGVGMIRDIMRNFRENYRLGADDEISIKVLKQPDYSLEKVKVSPGGTIFHMLLGEIEVSGKTVDQLKKELTRDFSEYVIDPTVYVELLEAHSAKYGVIGEVPRPGIFLLTRPTTVFQAITEAGGVTDFGNKSAVTLLRQPIDGPRQVFEVNVKSIMKGKAKPGEDYQLQAGDTLIVRGNTMKTLTKISAVTGFASLLSFIAIGGGK